MDKPAQAVDVRSRVAAFVEKNGIGRVVALCGGGVAALGALLPFAPASSAQVLNGWLRGSGEPGTQSLAGTGLAGMVLLALAVALAVLPLRTSGARWSRAGFGAACATLGAVVGLWLLAPAFGFAASGAGLVLSLLGDAALAYGYWRLLSEEPT